jgi:hypothetical protein
MGAHGCPTATAASRAWKTMIGTGNGGLGEAHGQQLWRTSALLSRIVVLSPSWIDHLFYLNNFKNIEKSNIIEFII